MTDIFESCDFYHTNPDAERLSATTVEDAIEDMAADWWPEAGGELPKTVKVFGWKRQTVDERQIKNWADHHAELLVESFDESEYGDPDEPSLHSKDEQWKFLEAIMLAAVRECVRRLPVWACDRVAERVITIPELIRDEMAWPSEND